MTKEEAQKEWDNLQDEIEELEEEINAKYDKLDELDDILYPEGEEISYE